MVHKKRATFILNSFVKHWLILIIFARDIRKELDANDFSFGHLTLILLLHYLVKYTSCSLAIYNSKFILGSARVGSEMIN